MAKTGLNRGLREQRANLCGVVIELLDAAIPNLGRAAVYLKAAQAPDSLEQPLPDEKVPGYNLALTGLKARAHYDPTQRRHRRQIGTEASHAAAIFVLQGLDSKVVTIDLAFSEHAADVSLNGVSLIRNGNLSSEQQARDIMAAAATVGLASICTERAVAALRDPFPAVYTAEAHCGAKRVYEETVALRGVALSPGLPFWTDVPPLHDLATPYPYLVPQA